MDLFDVVRDNLILEENEVDECEACGHRAHEGYECVAGVLRICGCDADYPRQVHDREATQFVDEVYERRYGGWVARATEKTLPVFDTLQGNRAYDGR